MVFSGEGNYLHYGVNANLAGDRALSCLLFDLRFFFAGYYRDYFLSSTGARPARLHAGRGVRPKGTSQPLSLKA
jgi:hypothetical protein